MELERKLIIDEIKSENFDKHLNESSIKRGFKCAKSSEEKRIKGNILYKNKNHNAITHYQIWKLYSKSIRLAPTNSEELATAYGNRSALLVHLQKYEESIKDIDRAIQITKSKSLKVKLLCRKIECFVTLGLPNTSEILLNIKELLCEINDTDKNKKSLKQMLLKAENILMKHKNSKVTENNLSEEQDKLVIDIANRNCTSIAIKYNEKYKRHLVATRDIKPGEIILIEKPFTMCSNIKNAHSYCANCFKLSWACIPCDMCTWCMFCSDACKISAWEKYHHIECPLMAHIKFFTKLENIYQVSIRTLIMGIKETGSIKKLKNEIRLVEKCADKRTKGFTERKFLSNKFRSIYSLSDDVSSHILPHLIVKSLFILILLVKYTPILGTEFVYDQSRDCLLKNKDAIFVGSLLLKLIKINCVSCTNVRNNSDPCKLSKSELECMKERCCASGSCIAPLCSLANHSCFPNSGTCFTDDYQVILFALRPIKKNSQIFGNYTGSGFHTSLQDRQKFLEQRFNFNCDCIACEEQWPDPKTLWNRTMQQPDIAINPIEYELHLRSQKFISKINDVNAQWNQEILDKLANDVEKAMKYLRQPSAVTVTLISMLASVFCKLFGMKSYIVPDECS